MVSRGLFGWSPSHIQPLTPVSEVEVEEEIEEPEEVEPPPAAVPFSRLFTCADRFDWFLMILSSVAATAQGTALVYLHFLPKSSRFLSKMTSFTGSRRFSFVLF
ncbi:hypothetical protein AHAS_Ahas17G0209200 [Arachis hypogaea]